MHRPRVASLLISCVMASALAVVAGCSRTFEEDFLDNYFRVSRMRDETTLANIATVAFRPNEQGVVQSFEVTNPGEEQRRPLRLPEAAAEYEKAKQADAEFTQRKKEYQDANIQAIERLLKAEQTGARVTGRDAQVQVAWTKWRQDTAEVAKRVESARTALDAESGVAEVSVYDPRTPIDVTTCTGDLFTKEVAISARVRTPEGQVVDKTLVVTLQRAVLKTPDGQVLDGRWLLTAIKDAGAGKS